MGTRYYNNATNIDIPAEEVEKVRAKVRKYVRLQRIAESLYWVLWEKDYSEKTRSERVQGSIAMRKAIADKWKAKVNMAWAQFDAFCKTNNVMVHTWSYSDPHRQRVIESCDELVSPWDYIGQI